MCCYRSCLVFNCYFQDTDISQGSVATYLRCGGIFNDYVITNLVCYINMLNRQHWFLHFCGPKIVIAAPGVFSSVQCTRMYLCFWRYVDNLTFTVFDSAIIMMSTVAKH